MHTVSAVERKECVIVIESVMTQAAGKHHVPYLRAHADTVHKMGAWAHMSAHGPSAAVSAGAGAHKHKHKHTHIRY